VEVKAQLGGDPLLIGNEQCGLLLGGTLKVFRQLEA